MTPMLNGDGSNPNPFIGVVLLIVLLVFVLPDRLPQFLSELSPYLFSGIPCGRLPAARDLAAHQSVIGRSVQDPLRLEVVPSAIGDDDSLHVRLTVINASLGTVPIVFQEENIAVSASADDSNGFGLIVEPEPAAGTNEREDADSSGFAESDIRLLGPRQRCVHSLDLTAAQDMIDDGGTVRAFYRMAIAGEQQTQSDGTRAIYPDQGLDILSDGVVLSEEIEIKARAS